jgi:hypothetical protein
VHLVISQLLSTALLIFLNSSLALAKPEYAVKQNMSCVTCHVSPWGGGPRTVYGKVFGSRDFGLAKYSNQDLVSASLRGLAYFPNTPSQTSNGVALMEAAPAVNAVVINADKKNPEVRIVGSYNVAPLGAGPQQVYSRVTTSPEEGSPTYILVGRFNPPFGLLTDEHRTYTRLQTNMTWNNYVTGGAISGTIFPQITYDFALVNDFQNGGLLTSNDVTYGLIGNIRWQPVSLPFFFGASQNFEYSQIQPEPYATSLYGALSFYRMTSGAVPLTLLIEGVTARNWDSTTINPSIGMFFIPQSDSSYQTALASSQSLGVYSLLRFDLTTHWSLIYKFDSLTLNTQYMGDAFLRNGLGFEYAFLSNAYVNVRFEKSQVTRAEIASSNALASQDDIWAMLRLWL